MFSSRFFTPRYWDARYFAQTGAAADSYSPSTSLTGGVYDIDDAFSGEYEVAGGMTGSLSPTDTLTGKRETAVTLSGAYSTSKDL